MGFRAWLRGLLDEGKYRSQYQMADAFGVKQPTVNHWLQGERLPDRDRCSLISDATGEPVGRIMEMVSRDARESSLGNRSAALV